MKKYLFALLLASVLIVLSGCDVTVTTNGSNSPGITAPSNGPPSSGTAQLGKRTKTSGFHEKDQVENYLHDQVCSGAMSLKDAQKEIATNWLAVYNRMSKQ